MAVASLSIVVTTTPLDLVITTLGLATTVDEVQLQVLTEFAHAVTTVAADASVTDTRSGRLMPQTPAAESYTKPARERQGSLIVLIDLPTKPHTHSPVSNGGVFYCLVVHVSKVTSDLVLACPLPDYG